MSWLLPWLHRLSPLAQSRKAETSGGEADSDHGNGAGVGSRRNGHRSGIRTVVETHFALTSSRPGHTGMPTQCTRDEDSAENQGRHPSRQSFDTTRRIRPKQAGSHLGSTLNPGGAVLTLGVFRRSRSVAYIRADASPSEVHTDPWWHPDPAESNFLPNIRNSAGHGPLPVLSQDTPARSPVHALVIPRPVDEASR